MSNKENLVASKILTGISKSPGLLWEKLEIFQDELKKVNGCLTHNVGEEQSKGLKEVAPLEHHFEGGLYTRELFMPKGVFIVSLIHKKQHPSFLLEEMGPHKYYLVIETTLIRGTKNFKYTHPHT